MREENAMQITRFAEAGGTPQYGVLDDDDVHRLEGGPGGSRCSPEMWC